MALKDAVLEVVSQMENAAGDGPGFTGMALRTYVLALKIAIQAAEGSVSNPITSLVMSSSPESASLQNATMIEQAREEMRKARRGALHQESQEARMVMAVGGPEDGTYIPIDPHMPPGAKCELSGCVYRLLEDGQLHVE